MKTTVHINEKPHHIIYDRIETSNSNSKPIYVFDLDGTIADIEHRVKYLKQEKKDYKKFFDCCVNDTPNAWIINLMNTFPTEQVYIVSGRNAQVFDLTVGWLEKNSVQYARLYMRHAKNYEADETLKPVMVEPFQHSIEFIVDDRQRVVDMWRRKGFNVLQCNQWEER